MSEFPEELLDEHVNWTKQMLDNLSVGGNWIIPRSLLVVEKPDEGKFRISAMPKEGQNLGAYKFAEAHLAKEMEKAGHDTGGRDPEVVFDEFQAIDAEELRKHSVAAGYEEVQV